jgi:WD40 repeat protein
MRSIVVLVLLWPMAARADGDALPTGALARIGTTRMRTAGSLHAAALSPDGRLVASGASNDPIRVWELPSGRPVMTLGDAKSDPWALAFSADGHALYAYDKGGLAAWDIASGRARVTKIEHACPFAAFSSDGAHLVFSDCEAVQVMETSTGAPGARYTTDGGAVTSVAISADGSKAAAGLSDGSARLFGAGGWRVRAHDREANAIAFSPDGAQLAVAGDDRRVSVHDAATGAPRYTVDLDGQIPWAVTFDARGERVLVGVLEAFQVRRAADGALVKTVAATHYAGVFSFSFSPGAGGLWATSGGDETVRVFHARDYSELPLRGATHEGIVWRLAFLRDGSIVTADGAGPARAWNPATGAVVRTYQTESNATHAVVVSPDGATIAVLSADLELHTKDGQLVERQSIGLAGDLAFSPRSGAWVRAESSDLRFQDGRRLRLVQHPKRQLLQVNRIAFTPDGQRIACATDDGTVRIVDVASTREIGRIVLDWDEHSGHTVYGVAVSPDGQRVAVASNALRIFELGSRRLVKRVPAHGGWVTAVSFSPDGKRLASAGADGAVVLWDAATLRPLHRYVGHVGHVEDVAFTRDGARLASAGADSTVLIWPGR